LGVAFWLAACATGSSVPPAADYRDKHFDYFVAGDPHLPRAAHTEFGLALMGGGGVVATAYQFIASHAGRGHIVILGAQDDASFDPELRHYGDSFVHEWGPVASAETIIFHDRDAAADPRVLAAIEAADGIFLMGGDQSLYVRYWKGTQVQTLLNAHVRANRPIGGSSAGLAILGGYSYSAMDGGSLESKVALADPFSPAVTLESDFLHYPWLEQVMTDTHFSARARLGRLIVCLARLRAGGPKAGIFGIGIDEKTALLIGGDGIGHVAPGSAGSAWIVMPQTPARVLAKGKPLSMANIRLLRLDEAGNIDLGAKTVWDPGAEADINVRRGKLTAPSIASGRFTRDRVPPGED
jgi:beta-aspartyl-peptidase (threonine type)